MCGEGAGSTVDEHGLGDSEVLPRPQCCQVSVACVGDTCLSEASVLPSKLLSCV